MDLIHQYGKRVLEWVSARPVLAAAIVMLVVVTVLLFPISITNEDTETGSDAMQTGSIEVPSEYRSGTVEASLARQEKSGVSWYGYDAPLNVSWERGGKKESITRLAKYDSERDVLFGQQEYWWGDITKKWVTIHGTFYKSEDGENGRMFQKGAFIYNGKGEYIRVTIYPIPRWNESMIADIEDDEETLIKYDDAFVYIGEPSERTIAARSEPEIAWESSITNHDFDGQYDSRSGFYDSSGLLIGQNNVVRGEVRGNGLSEDFNISHSFEYERIGEEELAVFQGLYGENHTPLFVALTTTRTEYSGVVTRRDSQDIPNDEPVWVTDIKYKFNETERGQEFFG
jgi:hypothetical protein